MAYPRAPLVALLLILSFSFATRVFYLGEPCSSPCSGGRSHALIFDESYYVNAARVIAGLHPPAGVPYADAPLHKDPNAEHPQLAKLIIAGSIELFGDNPWGWRLGSVMFGLIAVLAMYGLVRAARGSPWLATGAAAVMALDNLMLIHGRIATLDIYTVAMVLVAATFYVRGWALAAGLALGIAGLHEARRPRRDPGLCPARGVPRGLGPRRGSRDLADGSRAAKPLLIMLAAHRSDAAARRLGAGSGDAGLRPGHPRHLRRQPVHPHRPHARLRRQPQGGPQRHRNQLDAVAVAGRPEADRLLPRGGQLAHRRQDRRQPSRVRRPRGDQPVHHLGRHPRPVRRHRSGVVRA